MIILDRKVRVQILILMTAAFFVGMAATDIYIPALPVMVRYFNSYPSMLNLTLSIFSLSIACGVLFIGDLSDRYGRRKIFLIGISGFCVMASLMAINHNIFLMIVLRAIQGVSASVILIVPRLILKDSMNEKEQIRANGILLTGLIISPAIAPLIGAYLLHWFSWQSSFLFIAGLSFVILMWAYAILPETNMSPTRQLRALSSYLATYRKLLTDKTFLTLTLIYASGIAIYFAFIGVSSYLYIGDWHVTPVNFARIFIIMALAYLSGNVLMQKLNKRGVSTVRIIGIGVFTTLIGNLIVLLAYFFTPYGSIWLISIVTVGIFLSRAANALINPLIQIKIMSHFYPDSSVALGLNMFSGFGLSSLSSYLVILNHSHPFANLMIISFVFIIICVGVYVTNKHLI